MSNIIQINVKNINQELIETVSARDLHNWLEVGRDFSTWLKDRISKYSFVENQDYIMLPKFGEHNKNTHGGNNKIDYFLTLDMAKELAMLERSDKGRMVRRYFIECEKKLKTKYPTTLSSIETTLNTLYKHQENYQLELGKSKLGATVSQVNQATGNKYTYHKLADWCINNQIFPKQINPNAWSSFVYVYPHEAWLEVFNLDLANLFKE